VYDLISVGRNGKRAASILRNTTEEVRNKALDCIAESLRDNTIAILESNRTDMEIARRSGSRASKMRSLTLTSIQVGELADLVERTKMMSAPKFKVEKENLLTDGSLVQEMREPVGVVALVSEASPRMTVEIAAMCIKSGNAFVLSGGQNAFGTNRVLISIITSALRDAGLPDFCVQNVDDVSDETTERFITLDNYFDLLIPGGDAAFARDIQRRASIAMLIVGGGRSHLYIDSAAKEKTALMLAHSGADTLLVHRDAALVLAKIKKRLEDEGVTVVGCAEVSRLLGVPQAKEDDWQGDNLVDTVAVKIVGGMEEATEHIARYSGHTADGIVTDNDHTAEAFSRLVDSALICVNAPVAADYIGIGFSSQKNTRGPITLESLTNIKYTVTG